MRFYAVLAALLCTLSSFQAVSEKGRTETYRDLIAKARNLTLQRDRSQASQILLRVIKKESKSSTAYKESARALDELMRVFYTEKGQILFSQGEALYATKPREALESFQAALRIDNGNLSILAAIARSQLMLEDCGGADTTVQQMEVLNPISAETKLLKVQTLICAQKLDLASEILVAPDQEWQPLEKFVRGLQIQSYLRKKDLKRAKSTIVTWQAQAAEYPEVFYWKWKMSLEGGTPDRAAALKYAQLCQNLSVRKKQMYVYDLSLCRGREEVEEFLRGPETASNLRESAGEK